MSRMLPKIKRNTSVIIFVKSTLKPDLIDSDQTNQTQLTGKVSGEPIYGLLYRYVPQDRVSFNFLSENCQGNKSCLYEFKVI